MKHLIYTFYPQHLAIALAIVLTGCSGDSGIAPSYQRPDIGSDGLHSGDTEGADTKDGEQSTPNDVPPPGPPILDYSPHQISFEPVPLQSSDTARITIRNLGEDHLVLNDLQIQQFGFTNHPDFAKGDQWPQPPLIIEPSTYRDFELVYTPTTYGAHRGELILLSNDPDHRRVPIRIETISAYPEIDIPPRLNLGTVAPTESATARVEVFNRGAATLKIDQIILEHDPTSPQGVFSFAVIGQDLPATLERNHFIYLDITASSLDGQRAQGQVILKSNDPAQPDAAIELVANGPTACLRTSGDIDFGEVQSGQSSTETLTLLNCSASQTLVISQLEIVDDGGQTFAILDAVDTPFSISAAQTKTIPLQATMQTPHEVVGTLHLATNDPYNQERELYLRVRPPEEQ